MQAIILIILHISLLSIALCLLYLQLFPKPGRKVLGLLGDRQAKELKLVYGRYCKDK
jgi:hypothetical protein